MPQEPRNSILFPTPRFVRACRCLGWLWLLVVWCGVGSRFNRLNAADVEPVDRTEPRPEHLSAWQFRSDTLTNEAGCPPLSNSASRVKGRRGHSVTFSVRSSRPAVLRYPAVWMNQGKAQTNFNLGNGTIRLTYSPEWYHGDREDRPGDWCRLVECGSWALSVDPSGRRLVFQSPATDGSVVTNLIAEVPPMPLGTDVVSVWEIALSYTASRAWIQVNDSFAGYSNTGVQAIPSAAVRAQGVHVGSGAGGAFPARGAIAELETFHGATDVKPFSDGTFPRIWDPRGRRTQLVTARDLEDGLQLAWVGGWEGDGRTNAALYGVSRRIAGTLEWTQVASGLEESTWTDTQAAPGTYYEYRIGRNPALPISDTTTLAAARRGAVMEDRGNAILIVDETIAKPLARELALLRKDLRADGWTVVSTNVPRHADLSYPLPNESDYINRAIPLNAIRSQRVKAFIRSQYLADPTRTNVVYLIGHVPIPYSGFDNSMDGHPEHVGAFPADAWYGDMTGLWTDRITKPVPNVINRNIAGDGRLDQDTLPLEPDGSPGRLEVAVGRIDFSYLPCLGGSSSMEDTEVRLLRVYLEKAGRWKRGQIPVENTFRAWTTTDARFARLVPTVQRLQSRLWGRFDLEPGQFLEDMFQSPNRVLWGIHGDFAGFDSIGLYGGRNHHPASAVGTSAAGSRPNAMFTLYFGSYCNEWFHWKDDLLRVLLASPDTVLTATWLNVWQGTVWRSDRFHLGAPYGAALQDTFAFHAGTSCRTTALLGDPFLREHPLAPVPALSARGRDGVVVLNWESHRPATAGFRIYRADESGRWTALGEAPPEATHWTDRTGGSPSSAYMIKALTLQTTGSGSYTNSSLGTTTAGAGQGKRR